MISKEAKNDKKVDGPKKGKEIKMRWNVFILLNIG